VAALLATLVLLFGFQGQAILQQPLVIAMLAVPILIQVLFNSGAGLLAQPARWVSAQRRLSVGADRRQQLLRAGGGGGDQPVRLQSGAALATVVGVLIEVPVMLLVVRVVNASKGWYEQ
jgi:ACR3 family arsenite transporter